MAYLWFFGCLINQHEPRRRDITWDGLTFVGKCRHCGAPIQREGHRDWRRRKTDVGVDGA
jgi:hypothetical protein